VILEEVEPFLGVAGYLRRTVARHVVAADRDGVGRDRQDLPVLGNVVPETAFRLGFADDLVREELLPRGRGAGLDDLLVVEEVPLLRLALVREQACGRV
jgi:hypothetical protein